ncbi:hypothetical protein O3301_27430 [Janthinobacterium sp. SUN211]|uniref:hypothetical protein n=1 Tax=Janthinobacterium sp. SUN211 TaxID=3014786 RepID=UPI0027128844|nr:hypothetical protein [Janthinobacterium sp. SUN211]MDO8052210.1 hypothetical protein [Janthinobacterium sp. SUN211]
MDSIEKFNNSSPKYKFAVFMMTVFIIYFPKGGVKIGGVPLTWGYVAIFIFSIIAIPRFLLNIGNISFSTCRLNVIFSLLPFQSIVIISFIFNGVENFGFGISLIVSVIFLPFTFIILFHQYMEEMNLSYLFDMVRKGVIFVSMFGIFLFFYKLYTGSFLEIPFLTVNYDDLGELEGKHIDRGGIFKLISTYNNGNIYGICILMLLPLYEFLENSKIKRIIVKTSLVLTLSRTVWLGMIIYEFFKLFYLSRNSINRHFLFIPRLFLELKIKKSDFTAILLSFIGIILFGGAIFYMVFMIGQNASFLFDKNLGGRIDQLNIIDELTFFPEKKFSQVSEIVYMSILNGFGILGFLSFLLAMLSPVIYGLLRRVPFGGSLYKKSIMSGLIIYLILAISDGAFLYIPVMAIYWFLVSLLLLSNRHSNS